MNKDKQSSAELKLQEHVAKSDHPETARKADQSHEEHTENMLDKAVEMTFPASDPLPTTGGVTRIEDGAEQGHRKPD